MTDTKKFMDMAKRVDRIRALFIIHDWEHGTVYRDGKTRFVFGDTHKATVNPWDHTVIFGIQPHDHTALSESVTYSIETDMGLIEKFIETKQQPANQPTKLILVQIDKMQLYALAYGARIDLCICREANKYPAASIKLDCAQLVNVRDQLNQIIDAIQEDRCHATDV